MPLSVRLDKETQNKLEQMARTLRVSKSELVRRSLAKFAMDQGGTGRPFDAYKSLLKSIPASGRTDLSAGNRGLLRKKIRSRSGLD